MNHLYLHCFKELKQLLVQECQAVYALMPEDLALWKKADIERFQDLLEEKTSGRISEKSFYNYFKAEKTEKLPREDVLNMFCRFVNYADWADFVVKHTPPAPVIEPETPIEPEEPISEEDKTILESETPPPPPPKLRKLKIQKVLGQGKSDEDEKPSIGNWKGIVGVIFVLFLFTGLFAYKFIEPTKKVQFSLTYCFKDAYTHKPITEVQVEVEVLSEKQSNLKYLSDKNGCASWQNNANPVKFVVKAPYYQTDTVERMIYNEVSAADEAVFLTPDDYAMMIKVFSEGKWEDWKARQQKLEAIFAEDAEIIQIDKETGYFMEVYNKEEFIEKLTTPLESLHHLEVLNVEYNGNEQIRLLRIMENQ